MKRKATSPYTQLMREIIKSPRFSELWKEVSESLYVPPFAAQPMLDLLWDSKSHSKYLDARIGELALDVAKFVNGKQDENCIRELSTTLNANIMCVAASYMLMGIMLGVAYGSNVETEPTTP